MVDRVALGHQGGDYAEVQEMRERKVEDYLRQQVMRAGGLCEKHVSPGTWGVPDRLVTYQGKMFLVELKSPTGTLTNHQRRDHQMRLLRGVTVYVLNSKEAVDAWISKLEGKEL